MVGSASQKWPKAEKKISIRVPQMVGNEQQKWPKAAKKQANCKRMAILSHCISLRQPIRRLICLIMERQCLIEEAMKKESSERPRRLSRQVFNHANNSQLFHWRVMGETLERPDGFVGQVLSFAMQKTRQVCASKKHWRIVARLGIIKRDKVLTRLVISARRYDQAC